MTTLNPSVNTLSAGSASARARTPRRRLPAGFGLALAALASLSLWAGVAHLVGALIS